MNLTKFRIVILGDVDRNGDIDIIDATLIQKMALNITRGTN